MMNKLVEIEENKLESLMADSRLLSRLIAAGVDNWEGYESCLDEEDEEDEAGMNAACLHGYLPD